MFFEAPLQPVSTMEMNIIVKNPEIVFVADLTRSDAPALVVTSQCEVFIKNSLKGTAWQLLLKRYKWKHAHFFQKKERECNYGKFKNIQFVFKRHCLTYATRK